MKHMLGIFQWAIKFDYQFLASFQSFFFWFVPYFGQISPLPDKTFQNMLYIFFECIREQKTISEVLKT